MREIKFKLWNNEKEMFCGVRTIKELVNEIHIFGEDLILDQYTGLKDKKNNEIYEGDIIRVGNGDICIVKYEAPSFVAEVIKRSKHNIGKYTYFADKDYKISTAEILSNIHESY